MDAQKNQQTDEILNSILPPRLSLTTSNFKISMISYVHQLWVQIINLILKDKLLLSLSEYLEWECEYGDKYTYIMATAEIEM